MTFEEIFDLRLLEAVLFSSCASTGTYLICSHKYRYLTVDRQRRRNPVNRRTERTNGRHRDRHPNGHKSDGQDCCIKDRRRDGQADRQTDSDRFRSLVLNNIAFQSNVEITALYGWCGQIVQKRRSQSRQHAECTR